MESDRLKMREDTWSESGCDGNKNMGNWSKNAET